MPTHPDLHWNEQKNCASTSHSRSCKINQNLCLHTDKSGRSIVSCRFVYIIVVNKQINVKTSSYSVLSYQLTVYCHCPWLLECSNCIDLWHNISSRRLFYPSSFFMSIVPTACNQLWASATGNHWNGCWILTFYQFLEGSFCLVAQCWSYYLAVLLAHLSIFFIELCKERNKNRYIGLQMGVQKSKATRNASWMCRYIDHE